MKHDQVNRSVNSSAPGAWFITKFISLSQTQHSFTLQNCGLKPIHSFLLLICPPKHHELKAFLHKMSKNKCLSIIVWSFLQREREPWSDDVLSLWWSYSYWRHEKEKPWEIDKRKKWWHTGLLVNRSSDWSCTRGLIHNKFISLAQVVPSPV